MTTPSLTPHQCAAIAWLLDRLTGDGETLVALRGLAGTGKTTLIPALRDALTARGVPVLVGSPTHRAAMVLRRKGITDADTIHAHALTPHFTEDYARAMGYLGEEVPTRLDAALIPHEDIGGVPWLLHEQLAGSATTPRDVRRRALQYGAKKALESVGIYGREHFAGFGPKEGDGCLIIDEASMVGTDTLALCQEAFQKVCLIGDPGQLPPVKDAAMLSTIDGFDLTEVHRQAADSPILRLAYQARNGERFWLRLATTPGQLEEIGHVDAAALLDSPLIVWKNDTRKACTQAIRAELGYRRDGLTLGEPLVCRSTDPQDRADGFYNNALFRVVEVSPHNPWQVTVQEDCTDKTHDVLAHMEELHGANKDPRSIPFRFGYCLTAHTAQGGEWPTVYISKPDLVAHAGFCLKRQQPDDHAQWAYTAITRAKQTLALLTRHVFTRPTHGAVPSFPEEYAMPTKVHDDPLASPIAPPSAPMVGMPTSAPEPVPTDAPDDIPDPAVPEAVAEAVKPPPPSAEYNAHEALLHGFCQAVQARVLQAVTTYGLDMEKTVGKVYDVMLQRLEQAGKQNEHALYQFADAAKALADSEQPYKATVQARNSAGFPVTISVAHRESGALVADMSKLLEWMQGNGYTPVG